MNKTRHFLMFVITLLSVSPESLASSVTLHPPIYAISEASSFPIEVGSGMQYYDDEARVLEIDDLITKDLQWNNINRRSPNFGFTSSAYWFRFNLQNRQEKDLKIFIELPIPFLDDVRLFHFQKNTLLERIKVGDRFPYSQRPIDHQKFILPLTLVEGENRIFLRIASDGTVEAPLSIWTPDTFHIADINNQLTQGIWMGIMLVMIVYNLFLFFFIKDRSYLYYVFFVAAYLMFQVSLHGYGFAYLWPEQLIWNSIAISIFIAASNFGASMLVLKYLKLSVNSPLSYRIMGFIAIISFILMLLSFFLPYSFTIRVNSAIAALICILSLTLGYVLLLRGDQNAKYYCLAWTSAFVGVGVLLGIKFGVVSESFWANYSGQLGVALLVALLSVALANRFNQEKEMRLKAQESALLNEKLARESQNELLQSKENANEVLERKVTERTQTLQEALHELERANSRLEILSTTDALTSLYNRGHFEKRMDLEFKRAERHQRELSVILCDVDHFKKINDTYGHKAGDECLRCLALILKNRIVRSGDLIARYGGEEFIILLVDTPLFEAEKIARELCDEIRASVTLVDDQAIKMTSSFGVASLSQGPVKNAEQIVHQADMALYQAKHGGRDQVITWQPPASS